MKHAIFFDLDGTLWDATIPLISSYNKTMEDNNIPYKWDLVSIKSIMGLTPLETARLIFKDKSDEEGLNIFKLIYKDELKYLSKHPGRLYEGVESTLNILKDKYPLYIVSNADKGYVENFINALNMGKYFKGYIQAGDTNLAKWENIIYLKNKECIDDVIYVGDTLKDKIESNKAGVKFIHASYGFGVIKDEEYKIDKISDLVNLVDKLFNI